MDGRRRNYWIVAGLLVLLAIGAVALPSAVWACGLAALLGLAGVVLLRGDRWRTGALFAAALAVSLALLDAIAGTLSPTPIGQGLVKTTDPPVVAAARSGPGLPAPARTPKSSAWRHSGRS